MATGEPTYMEAVEIGKMECRDYYRKLHDGKIKQTAEFMPRCPFLHPESVFDTCNAWHGWHAGWNIYFLCCAHEEDL